MAKEVTVHEALIYVMVMISAERTKSVRTAPLPEFS